MLLHGGISPQNGRPDPPSAINLKGRWLEESGFIEGIGSLSGNPVITLPVAGWYITRICTSSLISQVTQFAGFPNFVNAPPVPCWAYHLVDAEVSMSKISGGCIVLMADNNEVRALHEQLYQAK